MRRLPDVSIPHEYLESGDIGRQASTKDEYFAKDIEPSTRIVLSNFVALLPEYRKSAVEMCIMGGISYEEAATEISKLRGVATDKKTVWRWARLGVEDIKQWLLSSPWVGALTNGKIPVEYLDANKPISLPWEDNDGGL